VDAVLLLVLLGVVGHQWERRAGEGHPSACLAEVLAARLTAFRDAGFQRESLQHLVQVRRAVEVL
jgi:hypothetical protein